MTGNDRRGFHSATLAPLAQVHNGNEAFTGSSHCGVWGWCSKRPGDRGQCRGTTTEHRSSPWAPHQPKLACNSGTRTFCSARKRCNSNGAISTFEIRVGELHATFLRNHNMRHLKGPQAEDNSSPEDAHPGRHLARIHATTTRQEAASTPLHKTRDLTSPPGVSKSSSTAAQPH